MRPAALPVAVALLLLASASGAASPKDPDRSAAEGMRVYQLPTDSMEPAIGKGSQMLTDERAYMLDRPRRGDVVVYRTPDRGDATLCKRIIGLPFETIEIRHKRVFVDGKELIEPYAVHKDSADYSGTAGEEPYRSRDSLAPLVLKAGEYFLLGDNRDASLDSRTHGPVMRGLIHGKVLRIRSENVLKEVK